MTKATAARGSVRGPAGPQGATGPAGTTTLRGAADYDNSVAPASGQGVLWVPDGSGGGKFAPRSVVLPAQVGAASGVAPLDSSKLLPLANTPELTGMWTLGEHGLLAASEAPWLCPSAGTPASGGIRCTRIRVPIDITVPITGMVCAVNTAAVTVSSTYFGLYDLLGNRIAQTANRTTSLTAASTAPQMPFTAQLSGLAAGDYLGAFTITATTMPSLYCMAGSPAMLNLGRSATIGSSRGFSSANASTLPASGLTFSANNNGWFLGLY